MALKLANRLPAIGPEQLLDGLDGRAVTVAGATWEIEAYGAWNDAAHWWIQLALKGRPNYILTLKLATGVGVQHAVLALSSWLANPTETGDVLNVA